MAEKYDHKAFFELVYQKWDRVQRRPWESAVEPIKFSKNCWYIGDSWIGVILISTEEGLILIDAGMPGQTYLLFENIHELGFNPKDIKKVLVSHGHGDHVGALKAIVEYTGAEVWAAADDAAAIEGTGGTPVNMRDLPYHPAKVDKLYDWEKPIEFGGITITPVHAPGHTPGSTAFMIDDVYVDGTPVKIGLISGVGLNGSIPDNNDMELEPYRTRRNTYRRSLEILREYPVDVAGCLHPEAVTDPPVRIDGVLCAVKDHGVWTRTIDKYIQRLDKVVAEAIAAAAKQ